MLIKLIFILRRLFSFGKSTRLLCVGVERTAKGNTLPGAAIGIKKIFKLIKPRCNNAKLLLNEDATKSNVLAEMARACCGDLAIIVFSCHGGQQKGKENETDGKDEFLSLYDKYLFDNEIWNLIVQSSGRVFLIFDCCYSGTMYRDIDLDNSKKEWRRDSYPDLLCWAACDESTVSYSTNTGGMLIKKICNNIKWWKTYDSAWKKISKDKTLAKMETVVRTVLRGKESKFNNKFFLS